MNIVTMLLIIPVNKDTLDGSAWSLGDNGTGFAAGAVLLQVLDSSGNVVSTGNNCGLAVHHQEHGVIVSRALDADLEFLSARVEAEDNLAWEVSVVDAVLDYSIGNLASGVEDHHDIDALREEVSIIVNIPEDETTDNSTLDSSLDVSHSGHAIEVSHGDTNISGLLVEEAANLEDPLVVDGVGVIKASERFNELGDLPAFLGGSLIVDTLENNSSLEHDHDSNTDGLVRSLTDVHLRAEDVLKIGSLPDRWVHGLELADEALGKTLNTEVNSKHVVLIGVEEVGADTHAKAERSGRLVRSNGVEAVSASVAKLGLVELALVGLGNTESPVSLILAELLQVLEEVFDSLTGLLIAGVDRVGKLLHKGENIVDNLVVCLSLEDGQDGAEISGRRAGVEDHSNSRQPDFVINGLVSKDRHEVLDSVSGDGSIPAGGPDSVGPHFARLSINLSIDEGLQLLGNAAKLDVLEDSEGKCLLLSGGCTLVVIPELGDILGSKAAKALSDGGEISSSHASGLDEVSKSEGNCHLDEPLRSGSTEVQKLLEFLDKLGVGSSNVERDSGQGPGSITVIVKLVLQNHVTDDESTGGSSGSSQKLQEEVGLHDSIFGFVCQELISEAHEAVIVEGIEGRVEGVDAILVSFLDGLRRVFKSVEDLLLGLKTTLKSGLGLTLIIGEVFAGGEERFAGLQVAVDIPLVFGILEFVLKVVKGLATGRNITAGGLLVDEDGSDVDPGEVGDALCLEELSNNATVGNHLLDDEAAAVLLEFVSSGGVGEEPVGALDPSRVLVVHVAPVAPPVIDLPELAVPAIF